MCHKYFIHSKVLFEIELEILKTNTEGVDFIWNSRKKSALMLNCASIFVLPFQSHSFFFFLLDALRDSFFPYIFHFIY